MKELISAVASVILILALIFQFTRFQTLGLSLLDGETQINSFADSAAEAGYIKAEDRERLKSSLSRILKCSQDEINVSGPEDPVEEGKGFMIQVTGPVTGIVEDEAFWKVDSDSNWFLFKAERHCISRGYDEKGKKKQETE